MGVVLVFRDVADERKAQYAVRESEYRLRQQSEKLQKSNQELEQFAYIASHDLQEPLHVIQSFSDLLAIKLGKKLEAEEKEYLDYIKQSVVHARTLIRELLEYSRVGKGKTSQEVDLNVVIKEVLTSLKIMIEESSAQIHFEPLPKVWGQPKEMNQLFQNLLSNAMKYRSTAVPEIKLSCREDNEVWLFSVQDNGIGIDPKYKEKIFDMFQRLHSKTEYSGTGIGLAICKKIVEAHGGRIWVESEPGKGSTFYFTMHSKP
jgi:light-regulated signal transduction histidine kinase (bacteriophytochrome)